MTEEVKMLVREVGRWAGVSKHPHRFGGSEFRLGTTEIGHVHVGGIVDIPFPVPLRDRLIAAGHAERHHWLPASGWTTVCLSRHGRAAAVRLLRLSYLRHLLKQERSSTRGPSLADQLTQAQEELLEPSPSPSILAGVAGRE